MPLAAPLFCFPTQKRLTGQNKSVDNILKWVVLPTVKESINILYYILDNRCTRNAGAQSGSIYARKANLCKQCKGRRL